MRTAYVEHVNITVSDIERSAALLQQLLGWRIRWRGPSQFGGETIHVGGDEDYIALYTKGTPVGPVGKGVPLNHIALVVPDLDAAEAVVRAAGLEIVSFWDYEPGKRFYFFDWDGVEFEMVSYA